MSSKWNSTELFSIESATGNNNVYANGRQSLRVRVAIRVLDINNTRVALSERERLTLTLVNYHGGAELKRRPLDGNTEFDRRSGDWDWSLANIGDYHYFPSATPRALSSPGVTDESQEADTAYFDFYVRSVSRIPMTVSVRITRDDGTVFDSGVSDSGRLVINSVNPPAYRPSDYQLERVVIKPIYISGDSIRGLHYYRFGLKAGHEPLEFKTITLSPGGLLGHLAGIEFGIDLVGYTKPGDRSINYIYAAPDAPQYLERDQNPGQIFFVRTLFKLLRSQSPGQPIWRAPVTNCRISALDVYGNLHRMELRFPNRAETGGQPELV